jgi:TolB-like protein/DNA-binding winged helix-turn-helix (wHTH) protein
MGSAIKNFYEFGPYRMDPGRGQLFRGDEQVTLTAKAFETLLILVQNSGQVVSKDELMKVLWPDTFVEEANLTQHISMVRRALGETAHEHRYIATLPGRGYRFAEPVRVVPQDGTVVAPEASSAATTVVETTGRLHWRTGWGRVLFGVVLLAGLGIATYFVRSHPKPVLTQGRVMLAVLPFQNLSDDSNQEYFSDGLTEETITDLGQLSPASLGVIARTSAMAYKHTNKTAGQVGQELGVDYILEGSVRREGGRARVSAQLIRVKDQTHVWAQNYDRNIQDFLEVQKELGESISRQVRVSLTPEQKLEQAKARHVNPDAYDDYLRGLYSWNQFTPDSLRKSIEYFQQAIEKDPGYAQAYAGIAESYGVLMDWNKLPPKEAYVQSEAAARKAVDLDAANSEAHSALGWQLLSYDRDYAGAAREFQRAIELNASNADAHDGLANYFAARRQFERSLAEMTQARNLDPLSLIINVDYGKMLFFAREYDHALEQLRLTLQLHPNAFSPYYVLWLIYQAEGRHEEADAEFFKLMTTGGFNPLMVEIQKTHAKSGWKGAWPKLLATGSISTWDLAGVSLVAAERKQTLDLLKRAADERLSQVIFLQVDPRFDSLHSDVRFQNLAQQLGLLP